MNENFSSADLPICSRAVVQSYSHGVLQSCSHGVMESCSRAACGTVFHCAERI